MFINCLNCKDAYMKGQTTIGIYTINPDNNAESIPGCDMDTDEMQVE